MFGATKRRGATLCGRLRSLFSYRAIESTARICIMRVPRDDLSMYHNATSLGSIDIRYCSTVVSALFCCSLPGWTRISLPRDFKLLREFFS